MALKTFFTSNKYFCCISLIDLIWVFVHSSHQYEAAKTFYYLENIRWVELGLSLLLIISYWFVFLQESKYLNAFFKTNEFYCKLMYTTAFGVLIFTIHFINWENNDYHNAVKVWEVASYLITLIYTFWLWYFSDNGTKILDEIEKNEKRFGFKKIAPALLLLLVISVFHSIVIFSPSSLGVLNKCSILLTLLLIFVVYKLFNVITKQVILNTKNAPTNNGTETEEQKTERIRINTEFNITLKYIERPTMYIFGTMLVYAGYCTLFGSIHDMEIFFSGAIAFELLLSSIVWSNTETV